jgi:hypothetical protein
MRWQYTGLIKKSTQTLQCEGRQEMVNKEIILNNGTG